MQLDPGICYRASASRDPRFDGRFFVGVTSTGIYCRPVCPARMPKKSNCRYFRCAAEAQEAGFRPCLRCRPESSPGTPAWLGSSATVARALRLIREGAMMHGGVDELGRRLGIGPRHLRRLLHEQLGASPVALERTRRVQFAKRLIDETGLPLGRIAISAGFGSVRRFNTAFREAYGVPPSAIRRSAGKNRSIDANLALRLAYRPPFAWASLLEFLKQRAIPGIENVEGGIYRRAVEIAGHAGVIEVRDLPEHDALELRVPLALADALSTIVERVRTIFDLDADPERIASLLRRDPELRPLVRRRPGLRVPGCWDRFELAVRAILGQQVTVRGATTLAGRLVERFGREIDGAEGELRRLFPDAETLADADIASIGMPRTRAAAIRSLAGLVHRGELELDSAAGLDDAVTRICEAPGIGDWTAQYVAMRALREPDAFPASDLGVRRALARNGEMPGEKEVRSRAEAWRPWRAYATLHLWFGEAERERKERKGR